MAQADTENTSADNVTPFPGATPEPPQPQKTRSKDRTGASRQAKFRSRNKGDRYERRRKDAPSSSHVDAPPLSPTVTPAARNGVTTPRETLPKPASHRGTVERAPRYASIPLAVIAYGFFALGVGINIWNAMTGGPIANVILPAVMGVLAESLMFFLPERTISLPLIGKLLAWMFLVFVAAFALTNSLRMASIVSADQVTARADRQTEGVRTADQALDAARARRGVRQGARQDGRLSVASGRGHQAGGETDPGHQQGGGAGKA